MSGEDKDPRASANIRMLVVLIIFVVGIVGTMFVMQQLRHSAAVQDCLASGRTNCAPIDTSRAR